MALYAISAVYFAGVMVRLMLTLTPVVCMLSAVAFSSVFEHYLGDDMKRQSPPAEDSGDEDDRKNAANLYDKVQTPPPQTLFLRSSYLCVMYSDRHKSESLGPALPHSAAEQLSANIHSQIYIFGSASLLLSGSFPAAAVS